MLYFRYMKVKIEKQTYSNNGNTALILHANIEGFWETWDVMTTNLNSPMLKGTIAIRKYDSGPEYIDFLQKLNIINQPLTTMRQGFGEFDVFMLNEKELEKYLEGDE